MVSSDARNELQLEPEVRSIYPRRSSRALSNDAAIRDATVNLILRTGIDSISFRDVGSEAGLTHGALYARFEDAEELLVDVWSQVLSARMVVLLDAAKSACLNPNNQTVDALLDFVRNAESADVAAAVVLFGARRFIVLNEEVEEFVRDHLENPGGLSHALHSRALILFSMVIIKLFSNHAYGLDSDRFALFRIILLDALAIPPEDVTVVPLSNPDMRPTPLIRDSFQSRLAYQTYSAIARSGYNKATISRIARRANCSPGAIYKLYTSKDDLVVGSLRNQMQAPGMTATRLSQILDEGTFAQLLYEAANDKDPIRKYFTLEMFMASAHNAIIRNALGAQLAKLISADSYVVDLPEGERRNLKHMINEIIVFVLAVSFLTTITDTAAGIDFNQIGDPVRRSLLRLFPSWPDMSRQFREMAPTLPSKYSETT